MNTLLILPFIFCFLADSVGNFHTERTGDAPCIRVSLMTDRSSAASNVQPADAARILSKIALRNGRDTGKVDDSVARPACPRSVARPAALSEPKISPAEMYARLIDERHVKWEPPLCLPGNTQEERILW